MNADGRGCRFAGKNAPREGVPSAEPRLDAALNEITYHIRGAIFEVSNTLGVGFLEKVYENALLVELRARGLKAVGQVPLQVCYKGCPVGEYFADILVEDAIILELKVVEGLEPIHEAQLLNYLRATGLRVGFLVNFRHQKACIKRMVYSHDQQP